MMPSPRMVVRKVALKDYRFTTSPSASVLPQTLTERPGQSADETSNRATALTSCSSKHVPDFTIMEPTSVSEINMDQMIPSSRTCLGCVIETKEVLSIEPSVNLKISDMKQEYEACSMNSMQSINISETANYGEQLLPDQLLSFSMPEFQTAEKKAAEQTENVPDQTPKLMYEGLSLEKCNGDDVLLTSSNQDWGYIESFISESKMELLDLCSRNELSGNLFSEEDVDNYMFDDNDDEDDDDESTLSGDLCSLKIRYESFQDNMREKTNIFHEETQFSFFPSVLVNCTKTEGSDARKSVDGFLGGKEEDLTLENECKANTEGHESSSERTSDYSPKPKYSIDSSNSAEDSEEESDNSSSGSINTFHKSGHRKSFSLKNICSSSSPSYRLRPKRKVIFSNDYVYDVDSIESEKREQPAGPKEEQDDDWHPKKRRKSPRRQTPTISNCILMNRFKGEKQMCVKLSRVDLALTTVSLNQDLINKYEKLAPLKDFWKHDQFSLAAEDKCDFYRLFSSGHAKKKHKLANRFRNERISIVEPALLHKQKLFLSDEYKNETLTRETNSYAEILGPNNVLRPVTPKSRSQELEEKKRKNETLKVQKFKSEARLRSEKLKELEIRKSMTNQTDASASKGNNDTVGGEKQTQSTSETQSPLKDEKEMGFIPSTCFSNKATSPVVVGTSMPVVPGGYLQTLLDPSDSLSGCGVSFFPPRQQSLDLSLEEQQFVSLQLAQSCVLSPPSESELQQSPHNCSSLSPMWHSQLSSRPQFATETSMLHNAFSNALPTENMAVPGFSQQELTTNRMFYEKDFITEQVPPRASAGVRVQGQFQRRVLHSDDGQLVGFLSVGSPSATTSSYSSHTLKSQEKQNENDVNETFLSHCSSKLVIQQSIETITPLRESTDLLDISNFTPDKFRHVSLPAELSPPETPNLSPQVVVREVRTGGRDLVTQHKSEMKVEENQELKWNCSLIEQQHLIGYAGNDQQYQSHNFNNDNVAYMENEKKLIPEGGGQAEDIRIRECKGTKSKNKNSNKQTTRAGLKKMKANKPRASKRDKVKVPRQNSRASKKLKSLLDDMSSKVQMQKSKQLEYCSYEDWPGMDTISTSDDQQEFEEPSNILSNIVSGMAEVQRFMRASMEPIWGLAPTICLPSEANKLSLKTLKILSGTTSELKKKSPATSGGAKSRKGGAKATKNQTKFNPLLPHLALACNTFDKRNLCIPGINGPAHKKMYRHKTSSKFSQGESIKGNQAEQEPNKNITLMGTFEKLRSVRGTYLKERFPSHEK